MTTSLYEIKEIIEQLLSANLANTPQGNLDELARTYAWVLADVQPSALRRGLKVLLQDSVFFPKPAELAAAARAAFDLVPRGHPPFTLDDAGQRFQDEMFGFARPLLTKEPGQWTAGQIAEFERLTGVKPRDPSKAPRAVYGEKVENPQMIYLASPETIAAWMEWNAVEKQLAMEEVPA